jgi:hypothetical protein
LCDELKIRYRKTGATLKTLTDKIQEKLLKNHSEDINTLLIIDEAQHLQPEVLEQLRLLTNLETNTKKLLQVILIGQPELQQLLQRRDLRQLAQRITARYHLLPLNKKEVDQYLKHRLSVAKCFRNIFDKSAVSAIHNICHGIPRLMNLLAERSLMNAYNSNNAVVNRKIVLQAAHDALGDEFQVIPWWQSPWVKAGGLIGSLCLFLAVGVWWGTQQIIHSSVVEQQTSAVNSQTLPVAVSVAADAVENDVEQQNKGNEDGNIISDRAESTEAKNINAAVSSANVSEAIANKDNADSFIVNEQALAVQQTTDQAIIPQPKEKQPTRERVATKPSNNFVVEAADGVSDELLASFQSAIEQTKPMEEGRSNVEASASSELMPLTQMPAWVQDGVPSLAFEMHIYASDGQGWVRVNGRDRYEGDYIGRELLLSEIRPQEVILSFRGEKFTMAALSSWN